VIWDINEHKERLVQEKAQSKKKTSLFGEKVGPETPIIMWKAVSSIENGHKAAVTQLEVNFRHFMVFTKILVGSSRSSSDEKRRLGKSGGQRTGSNFHDFNRRLVRDLGHAAAAS